MAVLFTEWHEYLPATTGYETPRLNGALIPLIDPLVFLIDPLVFSGIHFDITFPNTADMLIGSRLTLSNFTSPIRVSPDPIPTYYYHVPDSSNTRVLILCGLIAMLVIRTRHSANFGENP